MDKVEKLRDLLKRIQKKHLREPDTDAHEYCRDCGQNPYSTLPHKPSCLVLEVRRVLEETASDD